MKPVSDVVAAIGRTPLIKLRAASEATGCTILGKAEFMNPGGSVKDRAALAIINDAVVRRALRTFDREAAEILLYEVEALLNNGPAGGGGYRGTITPSVVTHSAYVDRSVVNPTFEVMVA